MERGVRVSQRVAAIDTIGCYIPGGRFSLVSTLLMTAIPAQVAGVRRIVVACPQPNAALLAAAEMLGLEEIAHIGGAQAIAALAYGTRSVPRVDKIFGPGNRYVTAAKRLVSGDCAIDMLAGPTELLVVATSGNARISSPPTCWRRPSTIPTRSRCWSPRRESWREEVRKAVAEQLADLPETNPAKRSLAEKGAIILAPDSAAAMRFANRFAPEHLSIPGARAEARASSWTRRAASFWDRGARNRSAIMPAAPITFCPPSGGARTRGGLSTWDFVRCTTVQQVSPAGLRSLGARGGGAGRCRRTGGAPAGRGGAPVNATARRSGARKRKAPARLALSSFGARAFGTYEAPEEGREGKLRLDFNENTVGCSPAVLRALRKVTPEQLAMYPEYEKSVRRLAASFGVRPAEMLLTNGVDDALRLLMEVFIEPGDTVLIPEPTFSMYRFFSQVAGARIVSVRYDEAMNFPLEETLRELARSPHILFIANPNNPTGTLLDEAALAQILDAARRTLVLVDEAYFDFAGITVLPWIRRRPNLVVSRTFSKAEGLAALRLGALFARADVIAGMRRAFTPYPVNSLALVAAEAALSDRQVSAAPTSTMSWKAASSWRAGWSSWGRAFFPAAPISCWRTSGRAARGW